MNSVKKLAQNISLYLRITFILNFLYIFTSFYLTLHVFLFIND